jgi:hypothetical protein
MSLTTAGLKARLRLFQRGVANEKELFLLQRDSNILIAEQSPFYGKIDYIGLSPREYIPITADPLTNTRIHSTSRLPDDGQRGYSPRSITPPSAR